MARALVAAAVLFLLPGAAQAKWLKAESPRFIVYSDGSERALRDYVEDLEVFDSLLRSRHGLPENGVPARKLPIYLVTSRSDLQLTWHDAGDSVAGYYSPGTAEVFAVAVLEGESYVLLHEYVHHFMLANFPGAYPAWMVEGYAEFYSSTKIEDQFVEVGAPAEWRSYDLTTGRWMPMADLLGNKRRSDGRDTADFYAESWLLTHYMMSTPERYKQFQAYASAVGKGGDPVTTMETATGMSMADFDKAVRKYSSTALSYSRLKRTDVTKPEIKITVLPPSADALLLERLQLVGHSYKDTDAGHLAMIRQRAAKFPDDELAMRALVQAELELGDMAKGRQLADDWIKAHPQDVEVRFVVGDFLLWKSIAPDDEVAEDKDAKKGAKKDAKSEEAETKPLVTKDPDPKMMADAREYLKAAVQLAPNDYRVLYAYAQSQRGLPGFPSLETQTLLVTAYKQAPQVVPLRFELIQVLMARGNWPQAEALLKPLVNNPHGGDTAAKAKELLKRVQEARARAG